MSVGLALTTYLKQAESDTRTPLQRDALEKLRVLGFPTSKHEDWKYSSLSELSARSFTAQANNPKPSTSALTEAVRKFSLPELNAHQLVFIDGRFEPSHSKTHDLPKGARLAGGHSNDQERSGVLLGALPARPNDSFLALNQIFSLDGAMLELAPGVRMERPVHLIFLTSRGEGSFHPQNRIRAGEDAHVTILESHGTFHGTCDGASDGSSRERAGFSNPVTEIELEARAHCEHIVLQQEDSDSLHIGIVQVNQKSQSRFESRVFARGGALVRKTLRVRFEEPGASCALSGLYTADHREHVDIHTTVDHASPGCSSEQLYKGILGGASHAVFSGKIIVHPHAQKSDARQSNKNLLLTDEAMIHTRPQLEIRADDVKCTHGATVGQLDPQAIYYMRSRGLAEGEARSLLTQAFAHELTDSLRWASLRRQVFPC